MTKSMFITNNLNNTLKELNINPIFIFDNLNMENTRQEIKKHTLNLSGIYMIFNKVTKDYYIGSASSDKFYARLSNHLIYFRGSKVLKAAVNKYGLENFAFLILNLYPKNITKENNKELIDLEDIYLKTYLPNYNILTEAGSSFGYKHTDIDRIKIYNNENTKEEIGLLNKKLLLKKALNKKSILVSKTKLSYIRPIILYNLDRTVFGKYSTIIKAAEAINSSVKTLSRALNTKKKLVKRQ